MTGIKLIALAMALGGIEGKSSPQVDHAAHAAKPAAPAGSIASSEHAEHDPNAPPTGYAPIAIDASRVGPLGLASVVIEERDFTKKLRTVGVVALDETKTSHVHAKVKGFIEAIPADFVGKSVKRGAVLAAVYSQAVLAAQLEHLSLLKQPRLVLPDDDIVSAQDVSWKRVIDASRRRLLLWDVPKAQIDRLEATLEPQRTYPITAPRSGTLVAKQAVLGNYVEPGVELFTISDLSNLWVLIDVYEADVAHVAIGHHVKLDVAGVADTLHAKVTFVSPTIEESTRTLKVRLDVRNTSGALRPGAFATAEMSLPFGRGIAVPETAVVHTGKRNIVFIVHRLADGGVHVVPREIAIGAQVDGYYHVTAGVTVGEAVATGAQFLIDSESRLTATAGNPSGAHGGH